MILFLVSYGNILMDNGWTKQNSLHPRSREDEWFWYTNIYLCVGMCIYFCIFMNVIFLTLQYKAFC